MCSRAGRSVCISASMTDLAGGSGPFLWAGEAGNGGWWASVSGALS